MTADALLVINVDRPERLFARDADQITNLYRRLAKLWHPDRNKIARASEVFAHLSILKSKAEEKLANGTWQESGFYTCHLKDGRTLRVRSDASRDFELGTTHISPNTITYVIDLKFTDLFQNAVRRISALDFMDSNKRPDAAMKRVYAPCLPTVFKTYETDDALILTIKKRPDDVRLRDLVPHLPKDTRDKHVAWITSRLHALVRYLDHAGIAHNAITLDTLFVSPSQHSVGLFGGWWYAAPYGEPLKAVIGETTEFLNTTSGKSLLATGKPDREMIRAAARELLGDRAGTRLPLMKTAPEPMINYLRLPSSGSAQTDIENWYQAVLPKSFGARRFTELPLSYSDIYQPGGV
jgi:hypothetical protein